MLNFLQSAYLRFKDFYLRNNNQIIIVKAVRRALKIEMNYAISVIDPENLEIFSGLDAEIHYLRGAEIFTDVDSNDKVFMPQYYKDEYLLRLKNTLIDTETGIAFTQVNSPVAILESSNILAMEVSDYLRPRNSKKTIEGEWAVLSNRSYAHWLLQDVPRFLRLVEVIQKPSVAISRSSPKHVMDFLDILGIEPILVGPVFKPETYICVSAQYSIGKPSLTDIETLRKFRDELAVKYFYENKIQNDYGKRIFISRRFSKRPLPNEFLLEEKARRENFVVVYLENMSFAEEIQMFMEAEVIIGATGAGLSNIAWINEKKCLKVVEIYSANFDHQALSQLAKRLNVPYQRVVYTEAIEKKDIWN